MNSLSRTKNSRILRKAIETAFACHGASLRKDNKHLVLIHPVRVAFILMECTRDLKIVAAGFLHDTVEDTGYTLEKMRKDFGNDIAAIVEAVTEEEEIGEDKKATWLDRKAESLEKLKKAPQEVLMVRGADLIDNVLSLKEEYEEEGPSFWKKFDAPPQIKLHHYGEIIKIIKSRCKNETMEEKLKDLEKVITYLGSTAGFKFPTQFFDQ